MHAIRKCALPDHALHQQYARAGAYTDCYSVDISRRVTLAEFIEAFYTTPLFRLERLILQIAVARPSSDAEARQLATGITDRFAAWFVEARKDDQVLLSDYRYRTRSWFMVEAGQRTVQTRLFFGSVVVPAPNPSSGPASLGPVVTALLGFHKLYSRALLFAASRRLRDR